MAVTALILIIALNALAFTCNKIYLYGLAVSPNIAFGLYFAKNALAGYEWIIGVTVCFLGGVCLIKAAWMGFEEVKRRRDN